jgi:hypothetical protein
MAQGGHHNDAAGRLLMTQSGDSWAPRPLPGAAVPGGFGLDLGSKTL